MSAWLIYVMMLADSVSAALTYVTIASIVCLAFSAFGCILAFIGDDEVPSIGTCYVKWSLIAFCVSLGVNAFVPSTKTVAMMIVIPRIATEKNIDTMSGEAKEIYQLAKDALKKAAGSDQK